MEADWWLGLLKIILINIVLSGDNAVVIAMACRNLKPQQQKKAIFWGTFGAVALRLVLTFAAVWLLKIPMVEAVGGLLLLYIAIKLLTGEEEEGPDKGNLSIGQAIRTIVIADVVMSLDNVVAVAGAAQGDWVLIGIGLAVSIPLIIWCSQLLTGLMKRFPIIVWLGAGLLGYTAGEMLEEDEWVHGLLDPVTAGYEVVIPAVTTLAVLACGRIAALRAQRRTGHERG
ncbi:YjbE family putative metal transport protein [Cohnella sp. CFH 77786]|uniref:TerC family protein n=1 Tax=Cohnella sp. CFH 77786 TaxID=2662265 RepID=UPI001C60A90F|nr:TerC family protein [Cohnella sp. CFH 77786]MBW5447050.1 YjbE family putative metal transport protein [Cohnella sp. CFH 77786]